MIESSTTATVVVHREAANSNAANVSVHDDPENIKLHHYLPLLLYVNVTKLRYDARCTQRAGERMKKNETRTENNETT